MVPPCDVIRELARVLEVDPGWLAFGEGVSAAPAPQGWAPGEPSGPPPDLDDRHRDVAGEDVAGDDDIQEPPT